MNETLIGAIAVGTMLVLIGLGIPISIALAAIGALGLLIVGGFQQSEAQLMLNFWELGANSAQIAIPFYLLMGQLVFRTGLATDLYDCIYKWLGRLPGGSPSRP